MRRPPANFLFCLCLILPLHPGVVQADDQDADLAAAGHLGLAGKYSEAADAYRALADKEPIASAVGLARCQASRGDREGADALLTKALAAHPQAAVLHAERAGLAFERGDYETAHAQVTAALQADRESLPARWWQAELHRVAGRLDEAEAGYKWFVDYYNDRDKFSAEELYWIGQAAGQFARWRRLSGQFSFFVNELYPDALKLQADYWPAHHASALLFLEKYNEPQAARELKAALAINPNAAEVHAAMAVLALHDYRLDEAGRHLDRAEEINPRLLMARQLRADLHVTNFRAVAAIEVLEAARDLNPVDEETLGRLAAAYAVVDGISADKEPSPRVAKIVDEVDRRNPHAGMFYYTLGATLDLARRFPSAARFYREALERMPQLTAPRGALGLMYLRLGEEAEAKRLLDESFEVDPFNVRVANSLKVLELLDGYAVLETEHFVLKFDRGQDELLARYAGRYLEEDVYPELIKRFGFEPRDKSLFEIFSRGRNSDAHTWFSARMVGLPYVSTVGACAGKMVALTSPREMAKKFNWARVLKHEFVHVLNLQQTDFNVPHWFTEALAVDVEDHARPPEWNALLATRVPKGDLFNLDTINFGFVRPRSADDWQMAYCQAQLYAHYMLQTYGEDALAKMLAAYSENLDTRAALRRSFGVEQEEFEKGYLHSLERLVAELSPPPADDQLTFAAAQRRVAKVAGDAAAAQELATACEAAAKRAPHDPRWIKLLGRIYLQNGDDAHLLPVLKKLAYIDPDNLLVRKKLAQMALTANDHLEAERWARDAVQTDLWDAEAHRSLGEALAGQKKYVAAIEELEVALQLDADNEPAREALAGVRRLAEKPAP